MRIQRLSTCSFKFYSPQGKVIMVDPWLTNDPFWPLSEKGQDRIGEIDVIAVTHAHFDHASGLEEIARKNDKVVVIAQYDYAFALQRRGMKNVIPLGFGARVELYGIKFTMVPALHSSTEMLPDGKAEIMGVAAGYVIEFEDGRKVYASGDTGLTADMKLVVGDFYKPRISILPVTGVTCMEPEEAAYAANMTGCKYVIPCHDFPKDVSDAADPEAYQEFLKMFPVQESYRKIERFMEIIKNEYPQITATYVPIGGSAEI